MALSTTLPLACYLDGRCANDEITITSAPPVEISYAFGDLALPISGVSYSQMYPECPITTKLSELGRSNFNMVGQYITNFDQDFCSFDIFTEDPNLENTTIPMKITVDPVFGGSGDATIFNIFIQPTCGDVIVEPVLLPSTSYNVSLW